MRISILIWATLSLALCGFLGVVHSRNSSDLSRARSALHATVTAAPTDSTTLPQQLAHVRAQLDTATAQLETAQALLTIRTPRPTLVPALTAVERDRVEKQPEYARFKLRQTQRFTEQLYGNFIHAAELAPEKASQLRALIVEKMLSNQDARSLIQAQGLQPNGSSANNIFMRLQSEIDNEIHTLLGPELFHRYKYAPSDRMMADSSIGYFEARLTDHGLPPLSDTQREALHHAYREASHPHVPGKERNLVLGSEYDNDHRFGAPRDAKIEQLVATMLSPEQLTALAAYHRDDNARSEIFTRAHKLVQEADHQHPHD